MTIQAGARVLVVEDYHSEAEEFLEALHKAGYSAVHAESRSDALAKAADFQPDVILLDLSIPSTPGGTDESIEHGFETLDALLRDNPFRPIVVITAHSDDRELMRRVLQRTRGGQFVFKDTPNRRIEPYPVGPGAEIDILAIRHDGFGDLWELKRPDTPIFSRYGQWLGHSAECAKALGQLMAYYDLAERQDGNGIRSYAARNGIDVRLHRPRGFVVIGRYKDDAERERLRLENSFFAGISILTYDDVIARANELLLFLSMHQNGAHIP